MKKDKKRRKVSPIRLWIERIILLVACGVFIYAAVNLFGIFKANADEKNEINRIREQVNIPNTSDKEALDKFKVDFAKLQEINPDVVGYIVVQDTDISYPVVRGKDNEYYLNHTFSKNSNYAGAIFMDYRNNPDLSDWNTFIYGHNVFHGTMFAELSNYVDEEFLKTHPYVYYYTPTASYKLQVASAYVAKGDSPSARIDFSSKEDYQEYINYVMGLSRHQTGVSMTSDDHMITLYTCSYENGQNPSNSSSEYIDERYFIHTKIVEALSGEMPYERAQ